LIAGGWPRARAAGTVDCADYRIWPYLVLAVFCGPLPLIMYFYGTRRSRRGALIGVGMAVAHILVVYAITTGLLLVLVGYDARAKCSPTPPPGDGLPCAYAAAKLGPSGFGRIEEGCQHGGLQACLALYGLRISGEDPDRGRSERAMRQAAEICRQRPSESLCLGVQFQTGSGPQ
jgi:hypothetical protein